MVDNPRRVRPAELNHRELERYVRRIADRWPIQRALLGGARVADVRGAPAQRERGPEYVIVLVSEHFDGVPWLERVYVAGTLWDAYEMGAPADIHCYTSREFERKGEQMPGVREAAEQASSCCPSPRAEPFPGPCVTSGTPGVSPGCRDASPSIVLLRTQSDARLVALAREGHERASRRSSSATAGSCCAPAGGCCPRRAPRTPSSRRSWPPGRAARGDEVRELRPWLHRIAHNTASTCCASRGYDYEELAGVAADRRRAPTTSSSAAPSCARRCRGSPRCRRASARRCWRSRSRAAARTRSPTSSGSQHRRGAPARAPGARPTLRTAATAVAPLPLVTWLASGPRGELSARIAELPRGAGGAGASAALAKAGTVVVLAGGAVAGPALVQKRTTGPQTPAAAISAPREDREAGRSSTRTRPRRAA